MHLYVYGIEFSVFICQVTWSKPKLTRALQTEPVKLTELLSK